MSYGTAKSSGSVSESSGSSGPSGSSGSSSGCTAPASIAYSIDEPFEQSVNATQRISLDGTGYDPLLHNIEVILTFPVIFDYGSIGGVAIEGENQFNDTFTVSYAIENVDGVLSVVVLCEGSVYEGSSLPGLIVGILTVNFSCK